MMSAVSFEAGSNTMGNLKSWVAFVIRIRLSTRSVSNSSMKTDMLAKDYRNINFQQNSTKCIDLTKKMYDETPQWVCLNSKINSDKTCRRVNIQKLENVNDALTNCSNDQYSISTEIEEFIPGSESETRTTVLDAVPGSKRSPASSVTSL
uniref:Uncharacterized protein n=1 Tax=Strigamia maritima TaxID=126957 RepID=T1JM22_STRMM